MSDSESGNNRLNNETSADKVEDQQNSEPTSFNPDNEDLQQDSLRGDAIGNTLYSERFVLSTLLKLTTVEKELSEDDAFENDLCVLWDMAMEEDVVELLLEHNVLELFAQCLQNTEDYRLMEILVGIVGNMSSLAKTRKRICENDDLMETLLELSGCGDALTLLQLMRLLAVLLVHSTNETSSEIVARSWYNHIVKVPIFKENLCFILSSATNEELLRQSLETLNAILAKFAPITLEDNLSGCHFWLQQPELIPSTIEAFQSLMPRNMEEEVPSVRNVRKTMQIFLNIHSILSQYNELSQEGYAEHLGKVIECLRRILQYFTDANNLLPLSSFEVDAIDDINDLFLTFNDPFDENCFSHMIGIWFLVSQEIESMANRPSTTTINDFEDDEGETLAVQSHEDFCITILDFLSRTVKQAHQSQLITVLKIHSSSCFEKLLNVLKANCTNDDFRKCSSSLEDAFHNSSQKAS